MVLVIVLTHIPKYPKKHGYGHLLLSNHDQVMILVTVNLMADHMNSSTVVQITATGWYLYDSDLMVIIVQQICLTAGSFC